MNLMSDWQAVLFICVMFAPIPARADSNSAAAKVQIFKCMSDSGRLSFQKSPCAASDHAQRLHVAGDSQANRDAASRLAAQAEADRARQQQRARIAQQAQYLQAQLDTAEEEPAKTPVVCPLVAGDGVPISVPPEEYRDGAPVRAFVTASESMKAKLLPTKTYLKNAGRWPDECPQ